MAEDANANIRIDIDTTAATAALKTLQSQIARFHTEMARGGAVAGQNAAKLQQNLINSINAGGQFQAGMTKVQSTTEAFTTALEKNKLSMGQYFRYAGASTKTFGRMFRGEFETITKVATERVKDLQTQYISMGRDANGALRSIKIRPLTLDMQNLATQSMITAQKQQLYNQLLKQGSTNLLNFGKNTQWAGRQLMVGFTLPLTMFASVAAKSFMDIEKQIIRIRRVYGDFSTTVKETDDMIASIKSLAGEYTKYGVAVKDTIGLASEAAAAGKTGQELLAQVAQATRLAVLGNVEQSQALETTMSVTNAFGVATEDLASKIDFLNAVENQSVTSIEDLTVAIPKAGPVVQQLGGDVEDLAFFLTAMKEGGINASEGANALKSGLAALINPTGKAKEMLKGFGINIEKIVNSNKGDIKGLVIDFASALDTLDPLSRARAIEQLFGKFQFSRLSTLFQNVIGEGTQAARVLELTKATTQELAILSQRELKKVEDTTTYKFEKAFADFQAAIAPVGEQFLKAVTPIIEFGTKLLNQFNGMSDGAKSFAVILTTVVAGIGPVLLMTVGLVANGVANLIKMFQALGTMFKKSGADTSILGMQTEYMTQQQLEAAAVAASLNQSHSRLTQTFSVEAAALNSLTAAYQKAVTAQRGFTTPGGRVAAGSTKPKKFANGGMIRGPGSGTSDSIPAMLSNGEAVIPAKQAKKYSGLIKEIISGNVPGFAGGGILGGMKNILGGMLGRSKIATRLPSDVLLKMLSSGNTKYQSGLGTGAGVDAQSLGTNVYQKMIFERKLAENAGLGIPMGAGNNARPTYGSVATVGPIAKFLNKLFGGKVAGKNFNDITNPLSELLDQYGDVSLIARNSVKSQSSIYHGDTLMDSVRGVGFGQNAGPVPFNNLDQNAVNKSRLNNMFSEYGQTRVGNSISVNKKPSYIESQTAGGFDVTKDIEKILIKNPELLPVIQQALAARGLKIPVKVGKYARGVVSVPGPKGKGDVVPAMLSPGEAVIPAKMAKKYGPLINGMVAGNIPGYQEGINAPESWNLSEPGARRRASLQQNFDNLSAQGYKPQIKQVIDSLSGLRVSTEQARQIFSNMNTAAKLGPEQLTSWIAALKENATLTSSASELIKTQKLKTGVASGGASTNFTHIGAGTIVPAQQILDQYGTEGLSQGQANNLRNFAQQGKDVPVKGMLGMDNFSADVNRKLATSGGATMKEFSDAFDTAGIQKWNTSVISGGGNIQKLGADILAFDNKFKTLIAGVSKSTVIFDTMGQSQTYMAKNANAAAISLEQLYATARASATQELRQALDTAHTTPGELRFQSSRQGNQKFPERFKGLLAKQAETESKNFSSQLERFAQTASPSKRTKKVAKDTVDGYVQGLKEGESQIRKAGRTTGRRVTQATGGPIVVDQTGTQAMPTATRKPRRATRAQGSPGPIVYSPDNMFGPEPAPKKKPGRIASAVKGMGGMGAGMGVAMAGGALAIVPGLEGLGTAAGLAGSAMMMIPGPIGIVVAALIGFVGIIMSVKDAVDKQKQAAIDLANAQIMSMEKLNTMAEDFGTVSATEARVAAEDAAAAGVSEKQMSAGTQYLTEMVSGQQFVSDVKTQQAAGISSAEIGKNVAADMATAVAQGVVTQEQATEIIAALGSMVGDRAITAGASQQFGTYMEDPTKASGLIGQDRLTQLQGQFGAASQTTTTAGGKGVVTTMADPNAALGAVSATMSAYGQTVGGVDAINAQYDAKVAEATTLKEINALEAQRTIDVNAQRDLAAATYAELEKQKTAIGAVKFNEAFLKSFDKDSEAYKTAEKINALEDSEFKTQFQADFAGGNMSQATAEALVLRGNKGVTAHYKIKANVSISKQDAAMLNRLEEQYGTGVTGGTTPPKKKKKKEPVTTTGDSGSGAPPEDKKLAKYNKKLDKQQKALSVINLEEDAINKKYQDRAKALEDIAKLNERIAQGQKDQLAVANALASGDIAAAASAVQSARESSAQQSAQAQKEGLDKAKQNELDAVSFGGMTRKSLEASMAALQMAIARREYKLASSGGMMRGYSVGGKVMSYFAAGGKPRGSDTIPAMLTPGEFVVKRPAVQNFGVKNLQAINSGKSPNASVYNYSVTVNAGSNANADQIASTVMSKIKKVEGYRIRGNSQ